MTVSDAKPGEPCQVSGIYEVLHDKEHGYREITLVKGDKFPPCGKCEHPKFRLVKHADHITKDVGETPKT